MGLFTNVLLSLTNAFTDRVSDVQRNNPEFKRYVSQYTGGSKEYLLEKIKETDNVMEKAAIMHVFKKIQ